MFSPYIWSDSLLATGIKHWRNFPACDAREGYRQFLAQRMHVAICMGSLRTMARGQSIYAFEIAMSPSDLEIPSEGATTERFDACRQLFAARAVIDGAAGIDQLLQELTETSEGIADFVIVNLQSQIFTRGSVAADVEALLSNDEWRRCVFEQLPLQSLETLLFFLTEWQLQQDGDWNVRVPHLLAYECERIEDQERRRLLLIATIMSSMAADIASPVERLIHTKRKEANEFLTNWRETVQQIAHESEPWVAARARGFLGTIDRHQ